MKHVLHILVALLAAAPLGGRCEIEGSDLDVRKICRTVANSLPVFHLNHMQLDERISYAAFNLFIDSLDPQRSYFLQEDIDKFIAAYSEEKKGWNWSFSGKEQTETEDFIPLDLHDRLRKGDIALAREAYTILMERIEDRLAFTEQLLEKGFDTTIDETYEWDRQDAAWAKDKAEWDDLWRKRIKNEYIARLVSMQVYAEEETADTHSVNAEETHSIDAAATDTVDSAETIITNVTGDAADVYDAADDDLDLSPEEFILERYRQFKLTMETFDEEMLLQRYLSSFSHVYDPHSDYMTPSSVEDFDINMKLSLVGIGAMLRQEDGMAKIVRLIPGGPADEDGRLKAGDKIVAVAQGDEEPVSILHWPLYKSVRLIRGEAGTTVVLTVIPASDRSDTRTRKIDIVRAEVKLEEQAAKSEVREVDAGDGEVRRLGVITLPDFYADFDAASRNMKDARRASSDVRRLINELILEDIDGLVLDLRNNGGGSLTESIDIAGMFITSGPIVQVKERRGVSVLPDADPEVLYDGPLVVLVNRLSASASEILAAALQDYKRAVIVGDEQTHGKGTVQTLMPLSGDRCGSLKLTTALFYRINGGSTQIEGVTPDIIIPSYLDVMDFGEDTLKHALETKPINPAMYRTQNGLEGIIPVLAEQSRQRLAENEEFQIFLQRRERLKERYETKTVSLSLDTRIAEAEAEKELDDIQSEVFLDEDSEDDLSKDLMLKETLNILSDMIDLKRPHPSEMLAPNLRASN